MADFEAARQSPAAELSPRARICQVARDLVLEQGYGAPTVEMVVERAGVPPGEFERHFTDLEDCWLQIYLDNIVDFDEVVFGAFAEPGPWRDRMRRTAYALARFLRERSQDVRFDVIEMSSAGNVALVHRERQLDRLVDIVDLGRQELDDPDSMSRRVAESVIGSIYELVVGAIQRGQSEIVAEDIVPDVMYVALRPYLGHKAALEEYSIPPPPEKGEGGD